MKKVNLRIKNSFDRDKGGLFISKNGTVFPATKNKVIWGSIDIDSVLTQDNLLDELLALGIDSRKIQEHTYHTVSAIFKFQKNSFSIFAENLGMRLAHYFGSKTSFNIPARVDGEEPSIASALDELSEKKEFTPGTLVLSMLNENEMLYPFSHIIHSEKPDTDIRFCLKAIKNFVTQKSAGVPAEQVQEQIHSLQTGYVLQYLIRDCFGDIDFTSKNAGLIYNTVTNQIRLAGHFDFGEMLNILCSAKLTPPVLVDISTFPEVLQNNEKFVQSINFSNAAKLQKFNTPAYDLGYNNPTFGEISAKNISTICDKFPDVAVGFLTRLREMNQTKAIDLIVEQTAQNSGERLVNADEQTMVLEYIDGKTTAYEQALVQGLQKFAPKEFFASNKDLILGNLPPTEAPSENNEECLPK